MSIVPLWRADQPVCTAAETDRIVTGAALKFASSLESIKTLASGDKTYDLAESCTRLALDTCLATLATTGLWGTENRGPSQTLWKIAGDNLRCGWLQTRAREKPLGYAGDHELLRRMIERTCTEEPLGRWFDRYFQAQSAPQAVRERTALAARVLAAGCVADPNGKFEVVGIGCGPALEIDQALRLLDSQPHAAIHLRLFDLCGDALKCAQTRLQSLLPPQQVTTMRENLPRLPQRKEVRTLLGNPDLILCPGLFDYLERPAAVGLLRLFWQQLADGGQLLVGNFAPDHASRAYMEWIGNWYLTYRSFEDLCDLATEADIPRDSFQIGSESTGTDWFLSAEKKRE